MRCFKRRGDKHYRLKTERQRKGYNSGHDLINTPKSDNEKDRERKRKNTNTKTYARLLDKNTEADVGPR